jgi:GNAT superfamily N-acetyltransferase
MNIRTIDNTSGQLLKDGAELNIVAEDDNDSLLCSCSIWTDGVPQSPPGGLFGLSGDRVRIGVIGHFDATSTAPAISMLHAAVNELQKKGCNVAVGPMDGNTWMPYRMVTESNGRAPFFLEPTNHESWQDTFVRAGFESIAEYSSSLNSNLNSEDLRLLSASKRLATTGVTINSLDPSRTGIDLQRIYNLSLISFRRNYLYTSIDETTFLEQYNKVMPFVKPELVLLAEHDDTLVGYLFAIPDILQQRCGVTSDTVVLKTVAVLPGRRWAGLGQILIARCHQTARDLGFTNVIHALMHDGNNSKNISGYYAKTIRRYTLFGKRI